MPVSLYSHRLRLLHLPSPFSPTNRPSSPERSRNARLVANSEPRIAAQVGRSQPHSARDAHSPSLPGLVQNRSFLHFRFSIFTLGVSTEFANPRLSLVALALDVVLLTTIQSIFLCLRISLAIVNDVVLPVASSTIPEFVSFAFLLSDDSRLRILMPYLSRCI